MITRPMPAEPMRTPPNIPRLDRIICPCSDSVDGVKSDGSMALKVQHRYPSPHDCKSMPAWFASPVQADREI
jgi:hypothetical protein